MTTDRCNSAIIHHRLLARLILWALAGLVSFSCAKAKLPIPQGWVVNGQALSSAANQILPAGATAYLPEKFSLEAISDSVVSVSLDKKGETQVHLLYGTAVITHQDKQFGLTLHANANRIQFRGTRMLLQNHLGSIKVFLLEGAAELDDAKDKTELSVNGQNFLEIKGSQKQTAKIAPAELAKKFPEITKLRRLIAVK